MIRDTQDGLTGGNPREKQIITTYCRGEDLVQALGIQEDPQTQMSHAEVMTVAITAAMFFDGNYQKRRDLLSKGGYLPPCSEGRNSSISIKTITYEHLPPQIPPNLACLRR